MESMTPMTQQLETVIADGETDEECEEMEARDRSHRRGRRDPRLRQYLRQQPWPPQELHHGDHLIWTERG